VTEVLVVRRWAAQEGEEQNDDGQGRKEEDVAAPEQADIPTDSEGVLVESVVAQDDRGDDHDKHTSDHGVEALKQEAQARVPADFRVSGSQDTLCEDQIDDVKYEIAGEEQDLRRDDQADIVEVKSPGDAERAGDGSYVAEAAEQRGDDEFVVFASVQAEDGCVRGCEADVQEEEDGCYGDVEGFGGRTADGGSG